MSYPNLNTKYTFIMFLTCLYVKTFNRRETCEPGIEPWLSSPKPGTILTEMPWFKVETNDNNFWTYSHIMKSWYEENVCLSYKFFEKHFVSQMMQNRHLKQRALGQTKSTTYCLMKLAHLHQL